MKAAPAHIGALYLRDRAPPPLDFRTRSGRLRGLASILGSKNIAPLDDLAQRLTAAAEEMVPDNHPDQIELSRAALRGLISSPLPVRQPLVEWNLVKEKAYHAALAGGLPPTEGMRWLRIQEDPWDGRLLDDVAAIGRRARLGRPTENQVRLALEGIKTLNELLRRRMSEILQPLLEKDSAVGRAVAADVRRYLKLRWLPGIPVGLDEIRNAWAHGRYSYDRGSFIVEGGATPGPTAKLSGDDLWFMFAVARMTWEAIQFDTLVLACHSTLGHPAPAFEVLETNSAGETQLRIHFPHGAKERDGMEKFEQSAHNNSVQPTARSAPGG